jgi:hypothetical protein
MRAKVLAVAVVVGLALGAQATRANALATQIQAAVMGALEELKFEIVPNADKKVGGPVKMKLTRETIRHLQGLLDQGKVIIVDPQGQITIQQGK